MNIVHIKTDFFEADAIWLFEMPVSRIVEAADEEHIKQVKSLLTMFSDALLEDTKRDLFWCLSFDEAMRVVSKWFSARPNAEVRIGD